MVLSPRSSRTVKRLMAATAAIRRRDAGRASAAGVAPAGNNDNFICLDDSDDEDGSTPAASKGAAAAGRAASIRKDDVISIDCSEDEDAGGRVNAHEGGVGRPFSLSKKRVKDPENERESSGGNRKLAKKGEC